MLTKKEGWVAFGTEEAQSKYDLVEFATHVWPTEEKAKGSYRGANDGREPASTVKVFWED